MNTTERPAAPTVGALFAGYGGIELALEQIWPDIRTAWVSEFDAAPSRILAHRFPDAPNHGDVTRIDWSKVEPVDIITGGSPCQDLSHAGKRAGMRTGTRSGLWASMTDAIDTIRPSLVIWENVRGALSAEADSAVEPCPICVGTPGERVTLRALGRVLGDLAELGYDAAWHGLRAADVGAPHGRWRVFVLAWPGWAHPSTRRWLAGSAADVSPLPTPVVNEMGASYTPETWDEWTARLKASHGNGNGHGASQSIEAQRLMPTPSAADAMGGHERRGGARGDELLLNGMAKAGHLDRYGDYAPAIARWETVLGRPAPSPTEPTGKGGAHRLSPRFVEWMMGLPDGWVTDTATTRNEQLKALGNGVVPQQAAGALRVLLAARNSALAVAA